MRLFTSGTTGKPKGVPVTNANEVMTCHDVIMHFPIEFNRRDYEYDSRGSTGEVYIPVVLRRHSMPGEG